MLMPYDRIHIMQITCKPQYEANDAILLLTIHIKPAALEYTSK